MMRSTDLASRTEGRRGTRAATLLYWSATLALVAIAFSLAAWLALMATSLDPAEMISAGADPWVDAARAIGECTALVVAALVGLRLWHTARFRIVAVAILIVEAIAVAAAVSAFYAEYL